MHGQQNIKSTYKDVTHLLMNDNAISEVYIKKKSTENVQYEEENK
jgi:hypothetical protein